MSAKRALAIAAAGGHSLLMMGPPGSGKTMLANRLPSILPSLTDQQALEVAAILSLCGKTINLNKWYLPPFRSPHHTSSSAALVGGGNPPCPGEISLAHHGLLFLDEFPEFKRHVLETLREPLESGYIHISRSGKQAVFPTKFQLIAAMNPCPCGYLGSSLKNCQCSLEQIRRYRHKISGPLLDRIDMHIQVAAIPKTILISSSAKNTGSAQIKEKVILARNNQYQRTGKLNAALTPAELEEFVKLTENNERLLENAIDKLGLSARAYFRVLRIARTIADFSNSTLVETVHLTEALTYRPFENNEINY
ncbi:MAG: Competence protein ComM [Legionellaceae bacterium]